MDNDTNVIVNGVTIPVAAIVRDVMEYDGKSEWLRNYAEKKNLTVLEVSNTK